jgi:HTH-type transcriptional regulator/antitoxin HigA
VADILIRGQVIKSGSSLDSLIDEVGNNERHPLSSLMETIGSLIETYESQNIPKIEGNPIDTLNALMEEHGLKQADLPGIGSQGVLSEILSGKRQLNVRQIKLLSNRFIVSPSVFV